MTAMTLRMTIATAASCIVFAPATARAQGPARPSPRAHAEDSLQTLPNLSDVVRPGYFLLLEASSDSRTGIATVAVENAAGTLTTSVSFASPLSDATKEATPLTLRGLANSGTASVGLHWFRWPGRLDIAGMRTLCQRVVHKDTCNDGEFIHPADRAAYNRASHAGDTPVIVTARGTLGRAAFSYLDRATLTSGSETHNNWSADVGVGRYTPTTGYVGIGYEYQRRFDGGSSTQICRPLGATGATQCKSSILGAPSEHQADIASIEWRYFFPRGRVALDPSLARDIKERVTALDIPVYFLSRSLGGLAGGARVGWRSDSNDVTIAVFIGAALGVTP